jgi:acyl dehydratase
MPIHLDEQIAKLSGLPGIIAHGLCMMAFTSWAVLTEVANGQTGRLRRLAVRFAKPVLPGQDLSTSIWAAGDGRYAYETTVGDTVVIKDGLAEVSDGSA